MGQLVMSFMGICLHLSEELPEDVRHRVVAIDASQGWTHTEWDELPPHVCFLEFFPPSRRATLSLNGWRLTVANAIGSEATVDLRDVPRLTEYAKTMEIRPDLLEAGPPSRAACYVDVQHGTVVSHKFPEGGVYTTWTVETDGDPELFLRSQTGEELRITVPSTPPGAHFPNGALGSVVFHNSTTDESHKKYDFALHYLAAKGGIPKHFDRMFPITDKAIDEGTVGLTTSCSNSTYP